MKTIIGKDFFNTITFHNEYLQSREIIMEDKQTIEEQPVSYKIAKLANEKGFDWPSDRCYIRKSHDLTGRVSDWRKEILKGTVIFAPTPAFLQRWLREKHEKIIIIDHYRAKYFGKIITIKSWLQYVFIPNKMSDVEEGYFKTYEDALEECLQKTLEQIK